MPSIPALGGDPRMVGAGAVALLVLLAIGFTFWRLGARQTELEERVEQEAADSTRFATTIGLITTLQARQDTIEQQIGVIREVDQRRFVWPHLLDEISAATPAFTWLTQISSVEAPQPVVPADTAAPKPAPAPVGPNFSIQGNAGSTQALTRFMKNLEASPFIRDVTLVTSEQVDEEGRTFHRYTLEARYEVPGPDVIETVPIVTLN